MAEPASTTALGVAATGITIFGLAIGIDPTVLLAGLFGGWWVQSLNPEPLSLLRRLLLAISSALLAGWIATPVSTLIASLALKFANATLDPAALKYAAAIAIGFCAHRYIGPWLMAFGAKKVQEASK